MPEHLPQRKGVYLLREPDPSLWSLGFQLNACAFDLFLLKYCLAVIWRESIVVIERVKP